ncbi:hypothetical protein SDC9_172250 [bioreactor metagenome]|uniref:Uncharacterized protein n=1 Tax=bioreactor metagenome TaxID=1076179 RepID=A0A645GDU4_9ZZZZ
MQLCKHRVKTVADIREIGRGIPACKGHKRKVQHFVRPVADEHVLHREPIARGQCGAQRRGGGVRVKAQQLGLPGVCCRQHRRGGRVGRLVGVQLDILHVLRLLTGYILVQPRIGLV